MKRLLIIIAVLLPVSVFAQANFHAGYILKNNGDTVKGYINYREWEISPKMIEFRLSLNDKKTLNFSVQQLKGFHISGFENYLTYTGPVSMDKTRFPDLPSVLDTTKKQDTIFLRQITTGKYLTLYYNADDIKNRFFIAESNGTPIELIYHQYYSDQNTTAVRAIYAGQLKLYANKFHPADEKLADMIDNLPYNQDHLTTFVNKFNGERETKGSGSRFYVGAALNATTSGTFFADANYTLKTSNTITPKLSVGIDFFNNPQVQQLIFRADLSFSYINPRFYYPPATPATGVTQVYEYNQYTAALTPQIILNAFNTEPLKIYIDLGLAINFSFYSNDKFTAQNQDAQTTQAYTRENPYNLKSVWANFPLQAGVVLHKRLEFYLSYTSFADYTQYETFYSGSKSFNAGFKLLMK